MVKDGNHSGHESFENRVDAAIGVGFGDVLEICLFKGYLHSESRLNFDARQSCA